MADEEKRYIIHLVFGPPGTGKTRYLTTKVREIVSQHGPDSLVVASFSVTAAQEIASRGLGLPPRAVGTLHSLAYRSIGHDASVALDPDVLKDWNAEVGQEWKITADTRRKAPQSATEGGAQNTDASSASNGDELLAALDRARSTFTDPADYEPQLAVFAKAWEDWKDRVGAIDYTDMIYLAWRQAVENDTAAPGNPRVLVVDEGQDMTPLETELALEWGKRAQSLVIALDDDQAIMEWRGGDPRKLLELGQDDEYTVDRLVLGKSYRIPAAAHAAAEQWVKRLSIRADKEYLPRTRTEPVVDVHGEPVFDGDGQQTQRDTGEVVTGAAWCVHETVDSPSLVGKIDAEISQGRLVMVIASCAYMLHPLIKGLREEGIPFHNPYRPTETMWNPLGKRTGTSTVARVLAYLMPHEDMGEYGRLWTGKDIKLWAELVKLKESGMRRNAKQEIENLPDGEVSWESVAALFDEDAGEQLARAVAPDLEWLADNLLASKEKVAAYPIQVARKRGPMALLHRPLVTLGTIHSVKGGDSDVVYLAPDISPSGKAQLKTVNGRDQMIRQFYVGMTRCRQELRLLAPTPRNSRQDLCVQRRNLIPAHLEVMP
jgi:DNA helicase-2/ATP-dependent DNA helicase PcrA